MSRQLGYFILKSDNMFRFKRPSTSHHYKNPKNKVQCYTNYARDMGSHMTYKFRIKLYKHFNNPPILYTTLT